MDVWGLSGAVAFVTGAASGIGLATADLLEGLGVRVARADVSPVAGVIQVDVRDERAIVAAIRGCAEKHGQLDILVNAAGVVDRKSSLDVTSADWDRIQEVDLRGTFLCCREAARAMAPRGGSIVNVSSQLALAAMGRRAAYEASKAGVLGLTRSLAVEWAPLIRVNAVAPGPTRTAMFQAVEADESALAAMLDRIPLGRIGRPEEIARVIVFLASGAASYITGQTVFADGGYTIR